MQICSLLDRVENLTVGLEHSVLHSELWTIIQSLSMKVIFVKYTFIFLIF